MSVDELAALGQVIAQAVAVASLACSWGRQWPRSSTLRSGGVPTQVRIQAGTGRVSVVSCHPAGSEVLLLITPGGDPAPRCAAYGVGTGGSDDPR